MSHTVHPYAHRLGIIRGWQSRWFASKDDFKIFLKSDTLLREYLAKRLRGLYIAGIEMERNEKAYRIIIKTSRPGMIIGRSGEGATKLKADVKKFIAKKNLQVPKDFKIDIEEVRRPEGNAVIVSQMIAEGLEKRLPFRMVMKQTVEKVMANREIKGARIALSGRLGGAEMSRREQVKRGGIPLQTFRADIEFAREKAYLPYGVVGIKVWIYKGEIFSDQSQKR